MRWLVSLEELRDAVVANLPGRRREGRERLFRQEWDVWIVDVLLYSLLSWCLSHNTTSRLLLSPSFACILAVCTDLCIPSAIRFPCINISINPDRITGILFQTSLSGTYPTPPSYADIPRHRHFTAIISDRSPSLITLLSSIFLTIPPLCLLPFFHLSIFLPWFPSLPPTPPQSQIHPSISQTPLTALSIPFPLRLSSSRYESPYSKQHQRISTRRRSLRRRSFTTTRESLWRIRNEEDCGRGVVGSCE